MPTWTATSAITPPANLPKRHGFAGDVPLDGSSGDFEWDGYIPFDELPMAYNPPSGIIATANQNPFPADYPYPVNGNFAPPDRALRIRELLSARTGWHAADMLAVQTDIFSAFSKFLAVQVVAAYDKRGVEECGRRSVGGFAARLGRPHG
jgi:penicillin amidase